MQSPSCPPARCTLEEWEAEAATLDHFHPESGFVELAVEVADARCEFNHATGGRFAGRDAVLKLARKGMRFDDIATTLRIHVDRVARMFCLQDEDVPAVRTAERIIRAGDGIESLAVLADASGLKQKSAGHLCRQLGVETLGRQNRKAGGGFKIDAETYEQIRRMRVDEGRPYGDIARALGLNKNTVNRICLRRGWKVAR